MGSNGVQKTAKTAEKLKNRLFHKNKFFNNFKLNMGGLGVSGGMAWTMRTDSLEVWRDLVLHGMGEVDFIAWPTWTYEYNQLIFRKMTFLFLIFQELGQLPKIVFFYKMASFCCLLLDPIRDAWGSRRIKSAPRLLRLRFFHNKWVLDIDPVPPGNKKPKPENSRNLT